MTEQKPLPQGVNEEVPDRDRIIVRTSMVGIAANILLAAFKAVVGILSHSIAITLDAVNNLSDALSSVITIFGSKLAGRRPDKEHDHGCIRFPGGDFENRFPADCGGMGPGGSDPFAHLCHDHE